MWMPSATRTVPPRCLRVWLLCSTSTFRARGSQDQTRIMEEIDVVDRPPSFEPFWVDVLNHNCHMVATVVKPVQDVI